MLSTATINSKQVGRGTQIAIVGADGFAAPAIQNSMYYISGYHGAKMPNSFWRERVIVLDLSIRGTSISDYKTQRDAVIKAFGLPRTGISTLTFTTIDGRDLQVDVGLRNMTGPFSPGEVSFGRLRVELIAPDPYLVEQTATNTQVDLPTGAGTAIPTALPLSLVYGGGVGETITLSGNGLYFPTITITGPCTNPIIKNNTTGLQIQVEGTFTGADTIVIDMENETVTQNGTTNLLADTTGDFWALLPGANVVIYSSATYDANTNAVVSWRDSWLGI